MSSIKDLNFMQRSLLFAKLASIAYNEPKEVKKQARKLGFTTIEFYDNDGAQAYRFQNKTDLVIACRGTQPTEYQDLGADMRAWPAVSETVSRVHKGFKKEVDDLWPMISEDIDRTVNLKKDLWFCGHSLGAAMATIMASRCLYKDSLGDPVELYTFGSPRVGWKGYCNSLGVVHHRWKNNNDIVTSVPPRFMGFKHHGTEHYINAYGQLRNPTGWQRIKDKVRGLWEGWCEGYLDSFCDHGMAEYIRHIEWNQEQ